MGKEVAGPGKVELFRRARNVLLVLAVLLVVTVIVSRRISQGEFHLNVDESVHAMTGLYFADFLYDLPLLDPIQYTYRYYAQYPALGLIHWPPFFHFVEGILFLLLGPSVITARLAVLLFALVGFYFWFKLVSELDDPWTAAASTALLAFLPALLLYEKSVMLEVPSLALCICSTYFWVRYLKTGASRFIYWFSFFASLALLTKQQCIYLAMFCLLTLLAERKWSLWRDRAAWQAFTISLLLVGPFYVLALTVHGQTLAGHLFKYGSESAGEASTWKTLMYELGYYWQIPAAQLGVPLLCLAILGVGISWRRGKRKSLLIMLSWIVACLMPSDCLRPCARNHTGCCESGSSGSASNAKGNPGWTAGNVGPPAGRLPALLRPLLCGILPVYCSCTAAGPVCVNDHSHSGSGKDFFLSRLQTQRQSC